MTRSETARRSIDTAVSERMATWAEKMSALQQMEREVQLGIQALNEAKAQSITQMTEALEPIAKSLAAILDQVSTVTRSAVEQTASAQRNAQRTLRTAEKTAADLSQAMKAWETTLQKINAAENARRNQPPRSIWKPALAAATAPTLAVLWLAWRAGFLF